MSKGRIFFSLCIAAGLTALLISTARADDPRATAKRQYVSGLKSYNLNEFQSALDQFKAAYRALPDSAFLFNIAQCQRQLNQKADAIKSYRSFLRNSPETPNRAEVEQIVAGLERELTEEKAREIAKAAADAEAATKAAAEAQRQGERAISTPSSTQQVETQLTAAAQPKRSRKGLIIGLAIGLSVVVVGLGVGIGVGLSTKKTEFPQGETNGGTFRF